MEGGCNISVDGLGSLLACYTEWRRADRHFSERTFAQRWWIGGRVCTPRKRYHAISKPLHWQRIPVVCSVLMSDDSNFQVSACTVAGPHSSEFLLIGTLERLRIQESPTHSTGSEACCSGCNCDQKSWAGAVSYLTVFWVVQENMLQMKEATFKMLSIEVTDKRRTACFVHKSCPFRFILFLLCKLLSCVKTCQSAVRHLVF
jgi:hypothetical protein